MGRRTGKPGNPRRRKIWISLIATSSGLVVLGGFGYWLEVKRDTDLADARADVKAAFRHIIPEHAPALRFTNVADEAGIRMRHGPGERTRLLPEDTGSGIAWGDYDGDGDPDLYVVNFPSDPNAPPGPEDRNRLFRNEGGRFVDATDEAGVGDPAGFGMGASFADYDQDGDLDLYVTNHGPNRLFRNRGDGSFEEVAASAGVDDPLWSTGVAWGDFDRDGDLDLYVCNYVRFDLQVNAEEVVSPPEWEGIPFTLNPNSFDPQPNRLYRNQGDGTFEDVAPALWVDNPEGRSLAATFCDLDNDGWLDIYVNNDVSQNVLFRNLGGEVLPGGPHFAELSAMTGTADPRGSMGLSVGDVSGEGGRPDGNPDLFITHWIAQETPCIRRFSCLAATSSSATRPGSSGSGRSPPIPSDGDRPSSILTLTEESTSRWQTAAPLSGGMILQS
ncbi:MAG: VCBS repeat-containing protein [candidate division NC10 bacterium]